MKPVDRKPSRNAQNKITGTQPLESTTSNNQINYQIAKEVNILNQTDNANQSMNIDLGHSQEYGTRKESMNIEEI